MIRLAVILLIVGFCLGCSNDISEVNELTEERLDLNELAEEVEIIYSDSAQAKVKISAPKMVRSVSKSDHKEIFPEGILIEFLNGYGNAQSWLNADYAIRDDNKNTFVVRGNVRFYNQNEDALVSTELTWYEKDQYLDTDKFIMIVQPSRGDTSYGFGFKTNPEFTLFEIKNKTSAKYNLERLRKTARQ